MNSLYQMCPVCTLYLRAGISLEEHLQTHAKEKVISALVSMCQTNPATTPSSSQQITPYIPATMAPWQQNSMEVLPARPIMIANQSNSQSIIYQQIMSSVATQGVQNMVIPQYVALPSPLDQQPLIATPTIPAMYQQRQEVQIVSTNPLVTFGRNVDMSTTNTLVKNSNSTTLVATITDPEGIETNNSESILPKIVESFKKDDDEKNTSVTTICLPDITITAGNFSKDQNKTESSEIKSNDSYGQMEVIPIFHVDDDNFTEPTDEEKLKSEQSESNNKDDNNRSIMTYNSEETILPDVEYTKEKQNVYYVEMIKNLDTKEEKFQPEIELYESSDSVIYEGPEGDPDGENIPKIEPQIKTDPDVRIIQEKLIYTPSKYNVKNEHTITRPSTSQDIKGVMDSKMEMKNFFTMDLTVSDENKTGEDSDECDFKLVVEEDDSSDKNECKTNGLNLSELIEGSNRHMENLYESTSRDSLNVRADEKMPPRGELSEQESNGASEPGWSRTFQEGTNSGVSTSFDLATRETWEASDCSDAEATPESTRSHEPSQIEYPCHVCTETFPCGKLRRVHIKNEHNETELSQFKDIKIEPTITKIKKSQKKINAPTDGAIEKPPEIFGNVIIKTSDIAQAEPDVTISTVISSYHLDSAFKCNICALQINSKRELLKHFKKTHPGMTLPRYQCLKCGETFVVEAKYTEHLRIHPLECPICSKHFYRRLNMRTHLKRHVGIRPFKCEFCTKSFLTRQKLNEHSSCHTGDYPYKCSQCEEPFRRQSALQNHRNRYHLGKRKTKDFLCHCGEICHSKKKFLWHSEIHDSKPKSCTYCNEKFVHTSSLTRHIRNSHNKTYVPDEKRKEENIQCTICQKVCLKHSIDTHMNIHTGVKPFSCNICNKEFTSKWNLKLHRWTHAASTSKPFKCTQCKSAFIRQTDYVAHMNSHKSVRPYTCNHCGRQFIRKYNCQRHVREHERDKAFKCEICNKQFHRSYYLIEHLRIHNGTRPFTCHICGKASATKSNHNKHVKIHHAREPISTEN